jgi:hypothetical protein
MKSKIVAYQYLLKTERAEDGTLNWELDKDKISKLFLGFPWEEVMRDYNKRAKFYYGFSISGNGSEIFPTIDAKVEMGKPSLKNPEFVIEVAAAPGKLAPEHRNLLFEVLDMMIEDDSFRIWWDHDPRGPRRRKLKDRKRLVEEVKNIEPYTNQDDLKSEDVKITIPEALEYFGFPTHLKKREVKKEFKTKYRQLQLQHHPDSETGSEEAFLLLQKCRNVIEKWIKR